MGQKVLVVDDEKHIVRLVQVNLEMAGFQVEMAYNGDEGLRKIIENPPDIVILDIMMPKMSGMDIMKRLQEGSKTKDIPVIFLTAKGQDQDVLDGWAAGVSLYLTKPFNPQELIMYVRRILSANAEETSEPDYSI